MFREEEVFRVSLEAFETEEYIGAGLAEETATTSADDAGYRLVEMHGLILLFLGKLFGTVSVWLPRILAESGPVTCTNSVGARIQFTGFICNVTVGKTTFCLPWFRFGESFLLPLASSIRAWTFSVGLWMRFADLMLFESSVLGDLWVEAMTGCAGAVSCISGRGFVDKTCGGDLISKDCTALCLFGCVMKRFLGWNKVGVVICLTGSWRGWRTGCRGGGCWGGSAGFLCSVFCFASLSITDAFWGGAK